MGAEIVQTLIHLGSLEEVFMALSDIFIQDYCSIIKAFILFYIGVYLN